MAILYIVSTPIGNLEDISRRALRILSEVDLILCEDTRVTKKLLDHYQIKTPTLSYHQHSKIQKIDYIINLLKQGKELALVSDAGTPGISDPGNKLVKEIIGSLSHQAEIVSIPGPSAVTAAASVSGFPTDKFLFLGFPPTKKKRKKFFEEIINSKYPVIFYESTYRIIKSLEELRIMNQELEIVVCRELTKKFETIYRGNIKDVIEEIKKDKIKGEFVVVIKGKK
ncbi:MAG: 16S rRNA (cytidine(1402)-2'-O)-methyltransferase [Candidatus Nealsonbacteria bacterium CG23_combo_of_CG06-09_8_20_14_all_37_18]|uniref:Ribosomal RNA small subunit methyltransferase I n=2 Tax=Candidatus Nealsoniibacteriota TaxID=1817911 RepID=A0A2G9YXW0_9BACT|nr:MAG: 16S rRNA (cytidine(1402)-2'-O)-methyltransferase [Candidatus Nealsonbacteria bacterium CG23_combo_of_CG06-09_8_20_14_all_37_18]